MKLVKIIFFSRKDLLKKRRQIKHIIREMSRVIQQQRSQKFFKCSCELFIQEFKFNYSGYLYFLWQSQNKQTQTLKYESIGSHITQLSQTLSLNLVLSARGGKFMSKSTILYLLNEQGDELDDIELNVNEWNSVFRQMSLPIGGGLIKAKCRRRQIMEVQSEESQNYDEIRISNNNNSIGKVRQFTSTTSREFVVNSGLKQGTRQIKRTQTGQFMPTFHHERERSSLYLTKNLSSAISMTPNIPNYQSNSHIHINDQLHQQLAITKKQLQDNLYLNNKLKNDRDVLLKKQQSLQIQIENILLTTSEQVRKLRQHYDQRIAFREIIYEQQIEQMVLMINANADYSKKVIEQLLRQKVKTEQQNKLLVNEINTLKNYSQQIKTKYQSQLQQLKKQLSQSKQQIKKQKQQQQKRQSEEQQFNRQQMQVVKLRIQQQKQQVLHELEVYKIQFQKLREKNQYLEEQLINELKKKSEVQLKLNSTSQQLQKATLNIAMLSQQLSQRQHATTQNQSQLQRLKHQNQSLLRQLSALSIQLQQKIHHIQQLQSHLQQLNYELEFNQDAHKQLKYQHQEKQQELYTQLENIQAIYNDKLDAYGKQMNQKIQQLLAHNHQLQHQLQLSQQQLQQLKSMLQNKQTELQILKNGLNNKNKNTNQIEIQKQLLKTIYQNKINQMHSQMETHNQQLQAKINMLQKELDQNKKLLQEKEIKIKQFQKELIQLNSAHNGYGLMNKKSNSRLAANSHSKLPQTRSVKQLPTMLNRSVQFSHFEDQNLAFEQQPEKLNTLQNQLQAKNEEISRLINRIEELTKWCSELQAKIKQAQVFKLVEYCDSEKDEQEDINKDQKKRQIILQDLELLAKEKYPETQKGKEKQKQKFQAGDKKSNQNQRDQNTVLDELNLDNSPKNRPLLNHKQSLGMSKQMSDYSNASYIKVSHSQKIRQLQDIIDGFEQREKIYKKQIEAHTRRIEQLTKEIDKIRKELEQHMKNGKGSVVVNEIEGLKGIITEQTVQIERKDKLVEASRGELLTLKSQIQQLKLSKQQLQQQLRDSLKTTAQQNLTINQLQSTLISIEQINKHLEQQIKKLLTQQEQLNKTINQLEQKLRQQKQHQQELRMQSRQLIFVNQQTNNQLKKYKLHNEQLEDKLRKYAGTDVTIKQLNKEIQEYNKKNLEHIKILNTLKLQKDSFQQQLKIVKKKHSQQSRLAIQWQQKSSGLQRTIDQYKRKQSRYKRQIQQSQQQTRKTRNSMKKMQQQLHTLNTLSTSFNYQKKKLMDELAQKGDELIRKEYQVNRLMKQLQKFRHRIQQSEDNRLGRKNQLRVEIEKLENDVIRKDKRILELEQQLKLLKTRLQFLQRENTKIVQKKTQTYGDKLKHYIDEIASIKKLLDQYQSQNTKLKMQNNQFYEQNQLVKISYDKLEQKYQQGIDNEENILMDLQHYMNDNQHLGEKNRQMEMQLDRIGQVISQVRNQLQEQRLMSKRKSQKYQQLDRMNNVLMQQNKQLKIKLNQLQTQTKISYNVSQRYKQLDRKKTQLQQQLKRIKHQLQSHKSAYVYKQDDMQKFCNQIRTNQRKQKQLQIAATVDELTKTHSLKCNKFQHQLLQMFNQNAKLRQQIQLKVDQIMKLKSMLNDYESLGMKVNNYQVQIRELGDQVKTLKQELKRKQEKISNDDIYINQLENKIDYKQGQLTEQISRTNQLQMKIQKLNNKITLMGENEQALQMKIKQLLAASQSQQNKSIDNHSYQLAMQQQQQNYEKKLFQLQLTLNKLKQQKSNLTTQYNHKMKSLEQKLQQMSNSMLEHQQQLEQHYQQEIYQLENTLARLSQELEDKLQRIDQLNQAILNIQHDNQMLVQESQENKLKLQQELEMFNQQYNRQKLKLKDNQQIYNQNIQQLQQQLTQMAKQISQLKFNKQQHSPEVDDKKIVKRLEEKMKSKDKKIQELKSNVYILQETILKLRKKQNTAQSSAMEIQSLKQQNSKLQSQLAQNSKQHQQQINSLQQKILALKQQLITANTQQQQASILLQQKALQLASIQAELNTTKLLYSQLQKQLQRRKISLTTQMQSQSLIVMQLKNKQGIISEQRQRIEELTSQIGKLGLEVKRNQSELKKYENKNKQLQQELQQLRTRIGEIQSQRQTLKRQLQYLGQVNKQTDNECKAVKLQLLRVKRLYDQSQQQLTILTNQYTHTSTKLTTLQHHLHQLQTLTAKHTQMQNLTHNQLGLSLQQLILDGYFLQLLQQKQQEISDLIEQLQEVKFNNDRKLIDYDMLKKENYQLMIKSQDNDLLVEQVESLRRICDKLQEEKKRAVFREELIKMHLTNILDNPDYEEQYKRKIQYILRNVASADQLNPVSFAESSFVH